MRDTNVNTERRNLMVVLNAIVALIVLIVLIILVIAIDQGIKLFIEWIVDVFTNEDECHTEEGL